MLGRLDYTTTRLAGRGSTRRQHFTAWLRESKLPHPHLPGPPAAPDPSSPARLENLPVELIAHVCAYLGRRATNRLALTCRLLHHKALSSLYRFPSPSAAAVVCEWACARGLPGTVEALLQNGFDPSYPPEHDAHTPLEQAAGVGCIPIIELLVRHGAEVNPPEETRVSKTTPLLHAIRESPDRLATAACLLSLSADPNLRAIDGRIVKPLLAAVEKRDTELIQLLLDYGGRLEPDPDPRTGTDSDSEVSVSVDELNFPLYHAIYYHEVSEDLPIIQYLLSAGANPNAFARGLPQPTPLTRALFECYYWERLHPAPPSWARFAVVDLLLAAGADVNLATPGTPDYPLHHALSPILSLDVPHHLLSHGADPNITAPPPAAPWTPLHRAMALALPPDRTRLLLHAGAHAVPAAAPGSEHARATPLGELVALHLDGGTGRAARRWRARTDWAKVRLLMEHGGPGVARAVPVGTLAGLLSLSVSVCRREGQLRRHVVAFGRLMWMSLVEVKALTEEGAFLGIWEGETEKWRRARRARELLGELCEEGAKGTGRAKKGGRGEEGDEKRSGGGVITMGFLTDRTRAVLPTVTETIHVGLGPE